MSSHPAARILVIEDDEAVRHMLDRALRTDGYAVTSIEDIDDRLHEAPGSYDLVVTNARVPYLSGDDLVGEIHRHWPDVPILHLDDLTRPLAGAMPTYVPSLMKPFSIESLLLAAEHLISRDTVAADGGRAG